VFVLSVLSTGTSLKKFKKIVMIPEHILLLLLFLILHHSKNTKFLQVHSLSVTILHILTFLQIDYLWTGTSTTVPVLGTWSYGVRTVRTTIP